SHIHADPKDPETVYVLNTGLYRSVDGGKTFTQLRAPHGDHHALWVAPNDPNRMINSNDGGATVSYNGGATWTGQDNQPTAQFYHVIATTHVPYKVCGSQQDNSTVCIASRTDGGSIGEKDWYEVGGGQSWDANSGDLTHNDKTKQGPSGGPITKDNTSVEYYNTVFVIAPSAKDSGVIWSGSDDGLVQVTRDGGKTWTNVTPPAASLP